MHPALSIIVFTTLSGAGYGLLFLLSLGLLAPEWGSGLVGFTLALGLAAAGLVSSTFHLGHPERAWRALSQWRSSWLSREGVAALVTFLPAVVLGALWVFREEFSGALGTVTAVLAVVTVLCTAMIYASLKTVRHWHNAYTPALYLAYAWLTGAQAYLLLALLFGQYLPWMAWQALAAAALTSGLQIAYWWRMDRTASISDSGTATGLGYIGKVRMLEPPHTEPNYLMKEMGFRIARRHATRLRVIALLAAAAVPALLAVIVLATGDRWLGAVLSLLAFASALAGTLVGRWLFFAEAKHTVTLYYGEARA